jgi:ribonuclease VapC
MTSCVLDSSALLAYLQNERGAENVQALLPGSLMSAVNVSEVVSKLVEVGATDGIARDLISRLAIQIVPFTSDAALAAGLLHRQTRGRGISLGDRACLSLAAEVGLPAVTGDQIWATLDLGIEVRTIR